ncbi:hypothetical protein TNCV_3339681 [Trichonephila clavipes]|nr:hypothetical protein TNCV_3339681 [Trichonephila clavipes]
MITNSWQYFFCQVVGLSPGTTEDLLYVKGLISVEDQISHFGVCAPKSSHKICDFQVFNVKKPEKVARNLADIFSLLGAAPILQFDNGRDLVNNVETSLKDFLGNTEDRPWETSSFTKPGTAMAGSDVVQSGSPIFDDFFQHFWPYIGNNTANVVFQMVKRLWLIRIDQWLCIASQKIV